VAVQQKTEEAVFLDGSLMRHVSVMAFTGSIGLMALFAVDFVDMIFISMLGNAALAAAVGFAGTILFFTNSINIGLSIAAGSLVARAIGAGDRKAAREYAGSVACFGVLISLLVPGVLWFFLEDVLAMLGASGETSALAASYLRIILPTMAVVSVAMIGMAVLRAHGDARRSMFATLAGGIVNAVLDPILIFGLNMELEGAAWASVAARFMMLFAALWPAIRVHDGFAMPRAAGLLKDVKAISNIALPAVLANVATPVGSAVVMREIAKFGTDAVAGFAVIGRLTPVAFAVVFALSGAIGPIIGQNFGAGKMDRVQGAFRAGIIFVAIYTLVAALVLFLVRDLIIAIFEAEGTSRDLIVLFAGPLALLFFFNGVIFVANASFNNLGHASYSTYVNWGRNTLGTWPLAIWGGAVLGAPGVLIGQAVGGILFALVAILMMRRALVTAEVTVAPQDPFQAHRRFHLLFGRRGW